MGIVFGRYSGKGSVRDKEGMTEVIAGDAFVFGPDEPHQLSNLWRPRTLPFT